MSITNTNLGNITNINSINVNVNNNVQYLEPQTFYFNSTTKTMTTTVPTSDIVTNFVLDYAIGNVEFLTGIYTFTSNPFINFKNNQVIIELTGFTSASNTGFGLELFFELYKNNVRLRSSRDSFFITDTTIKTDPYISILESNIGESTINDVFSIYLYFSRYSDGINAITARLNLDKSFITIMNSHNKGYEYIEKNRNWWDDVVVLINTDYNFTNEFVITKGCWIIELSLTFFVVANGVHAFFIKSKNNITNTIVNNTLHYWGALTLAGGNHTVKTRQIINTNTFMRIQQLIYWINVGSGTNMTIRGSNSTFANYIRYIKIG
jgi:hypothetical protein